MATPPQVTASGDTSLQLWDVVGNSSISTFKAHTGSVKAVDVKADEPCEGPSFTLFPIGCIGLISLLFVQLSLSQEGGMEVFWCGTQDAP